MKVQINLLPDQSPDQLAESLEVAVRCARHRAYQPHQDGLISSAVWPDWTRITHRFVVREYARNGKRSITIRQQELG